MPQRCKTLWSGREVLWRAGDGDVVAAPAHCAQLSTQPARTSVQDWPVLVGGDRRYMVGVPLAAGQRSGQVDDGLAPPSSQTTTFTPPLTKVPGPVTASTQYGPCTSTSVPGLTAGSRSATIFYPSRSCLDLLKSASLTFTINWNTGQQSIISGNTTVSVVGALLVVSLVTLEITSLP
jgi:hypothetical protein